MMHCPICGNTKTRALATVRGGAAMQNFLAHTLTEALRAQSTSIDLRGCERCLFVWNATFDQKKIRYAEGYCNDTYHSGIFRRYLEGLAKRLVKTHHLAPRRVLEIGCGQGVFLGLLSRAGAKRLSGLDPAYAKTKTPMDRMVRRELFPPRRPVVSDFIICMEVLEHIPDVRGFLKHINASLAPTGGLYFEVPSFEWIIGQRTIFDFTYEHCNYFSPLPLAWAFGGTGFGNIRFTRGVHGQYIGIEAGRGRIERLPKPSFTLDEIPQFIGKELARYKKELARWKRFAVWGVAGKGVTFLTRLDITRVRSSFAIDINPVKQGRFVPITGQIVAHPEVLRRARIDTILVMNPIYEKEIKRMARRYGYHGRFVIPYGSR